MALLVKWIVWIGIAVTVHIIFIIALYSHDRHENMARTMKSDRSMILVRFCDFISKYFSWEIFQLIFGMISRS